MLLAVLRAGLICRSPADALAASRHGSGPRRIGARALVVPRRVGAVDHGDVAVHVAAETFTIRFVFGFGDPLPVGVISLNDVFTAPAAAVSKERGGDRANHVAAVTFEVMSDGIIPLARGHARLAAAGAAVVSAFGGAGADARIISGASIASWAGLACGVLAWLLTGGTLVLHHPFSADVFALQRHRERCTLAVPPGPVLSILSDARLLGSAAVLALWRTPERVTPGNWLVADPGRTIVDLWAFGEIAVVASRRGWQSRCASPRFGRTSSEGQRGAGARSNADPCWHVGVSGRRRSMPSIPSREAARLSGQAPNCRKRVCRYGVAVSVRSSDRSHRHYRPSVRDCQRRGLSGAMARTCGDRGGR